MRAGRPRYGTGTVLHVGPGVDRRGRRMSRRGRSRRRAASAAAWAAAIRSLRHLRSGSKHDLTGGAVDEESVPGLDVVESRQQPTTPGMPSWRAMIVVWLVDAAQRRGDRRRLTDGSRPAVSAGARSSAQRTLGVSGIGMPGSDWPVSSATTRSRMSCRSVTRSAIGPPAPRNISLSWSTAATVAAASRLPEPSWAPRTRADQASVARERGGHHQHLGGGAAGMRGAPLKPRSGDSLGGGTESLGALLRRGRARLPAPPAGAWAAPPDPCRHPAPRRSPAGSS